MGTPNDIKNLGWRQGAVLPIEVVDAVREQLIVQCLSKEGLDQAWFVVVSQDCDLVHGSYEAEPFVELVVGRPSETSDQVKMHGRNPRILHLSGHVSDQQQCLVFDVHEKVRIHRNFLSEHPPCRIRDIDSSDVDTITEWLAKRYTRAAFPDAFNDRLVDAHKKIDKVLKKSGELVTGIFLRLSDWDELPIEAPYEIILRATAKKGALRALAVEKELAGVVCRLRDAMNGCEGILVIDAALVSEAEFTLDDLRDFERWDFDFRSRSGEPGGEMVPVK